MRVEQIAVFLENKSGRLAEITAILADNNINIRAISVADTADTPTLLAKRLTATRSSPSVSS